MAAAFERIKSISSDKRREDPTYDNLEYLFRVMEAGGVGNTANPERVQVGCQSYWEEFAASRDLLKESIQRELGITLEVKTVNFHSQENGGDQMDVKFLYWPEKDKYIVCLTPDDSTYDYSALTGHGRLRLAVARHYLRDNDFVAINPSQFLIFDDQASQEHRKQCMDKRKLSQLLELSAR
mmetsp:Transcript_46347/g.53408  ORF Transcript_46347/g.53408 Transcript_46347/m.53408 type:complete len:181 (+) Transcript_46347:1-543(+)